MQRYSLHRRKRRLGRLAHWLLRRFKGVSKGVLIKNIILAAIALFFLSSLLGLGAYAWYSRDLPDPNTLLARSVDQSTKIYDRTGTQLIYEVAADEKRTLIPYEQIPKDCVNAAITAEDRSFFEHRGIDFRGIARALVNDIIHLRAGQGASTITQQFVKNAILTNERTVTRKVKEIILSLALERTYSKEQILQLYFNEIGYGGMHYGIESAALEYYDKHTSELDLAQCATLAGLVQLPTTYLNNPDRLLTRRNWILDSMVELGYATQAEVDAAKAQDTTIAAKADHGQALHFVFWIKQLLEETYPDRDIEREGLSVITTLDVDKQKAAEEAVTYGVTQNSERYGFNNAGLVSLDAKTGQVLAMVGSADYSNEEIQGQVNVTLRPLQPGSSMKPLIYTAAFEKGYTPNTLLWDVNTTFPTETGAYAPRDYDGGERGILTMRQALQGSLNIPAVKTLYLVGIDRALSFLERLGYTTLTDRSQYGLSLVLGGGEVKLLEHANAFATLANSGLKHDVVGVLKVTAADGTVLEEWKPEEHPGEQVLDRNIAAITSNVLSDDAARQYIFGAGNLLHISGRPVAAKTGTTNDYNDAWTMGYTPSLVAGVWVGNTDGTEMNRGADGSIVAAPIWYKYMTEALAGTPVENFPAAEIPETGKAVLDGHLPGTTVTIDTVSGKLATNETPERFKKTVTCGEYHTILTYLDKDDPRGAVPNNPEKDAMYSPWEAAVLDFIARHNAALKDGEVPYESCAVPTEYDDVHTRQNEPSITLVSPHSGDSVGRTVSAAYQVALKRSLGRVEFAIDGNYVASSSSMDSAAFTLPSWVNRGSHTLAVTVFDDVDNSATASVSVQVTEDGAENSLRITNPFSNQDIEKNGSAYNIVIEVPGAGDYTYLEVTVQERGSGATTLAGSTDSPAAITSIPWNLPAAGEYILTARAATSGGETRESPSINVTVTEGSSGAVSTLL